MKLLAIFFPKEIEDNDASDMYVPLNEKTAEEIKKQLEPTNMEKFLKICLDALDTDPSTPDVVKDELGCANTLSVLIKKLYPDFPIIVSTKDLDWKLWQDKRFKRITEPEIGAIIISPRTNTQYGHCGVWITSEKIASNNSRTGLWQGNYSWSSWIQEFKINRKLPIYIYQLAE